MSARCEKHSALEANAYTEPVFILCNDCKAAEELAQATIQRDSEEYIERHTERWMRRIFPTWLLVCVWFAHEFAAFLLQPGRRVATESSL